MMPNLNQEVSEEMAKNRKTKKQKKLGFLNKALLITYTVFLLMAMVLYYVIIYEPAHYKAEEVRIPDVAWAAQNAVKTSVENMTGLEVLSVNVNVQGITFDKKQEAVEEKVEG